MVEISRKPLSHFLEISLSWWSSIISRVQNVRMVSYPVLPIIPGVPFNRALFLVAGENGVRSLGGTHLTNRKLDRGPEGVYILVAVGGGA
jgi:hypothetical protein